MNPSEVNFFDIVTLLVALWAVISGWRRGVILQLGSLAGILLSLYLAAHYGQEAGRLLHLGESWQTAGGFIVVALVTLIGVALLGRLLRKLFQFAGLGLLDILFGILISLTKWLLLLSALYTAFGALNRTLNLVEKEAFARSRTYYPVCRVAEVVMPHLEKVLEGADLEEWIPEVEAKSEGEVQTIKHTKDGK